ncbi:alpha-galactosidase A-like isoform X1 [Mytilus galloprovincialis]|uniref:alpha-galactosidase A-like isoform X1 n=2 Tax=Mytilus galloprovincialis TaxID=29158 RepID=UPI003F7BA230
MMMFPVAVIYSVLINYLTVALDNGLARTPPMGWMSWERFRCFTDCEAEPDNCISAKLLMQMADQMVDGGYLDAGYEYLAVDDCWMAHQRNSSDGRLMADPLRFPGGMKPVIDYIHSKGLKFGLYGDVGSKTCQGYPGNEFYIPLDAETYASWGVDMLKIDCCYASHSVEGIEVMGFFLNKTGRPFLYVCCSCANPEGTYTPGANTCNTVRSYMDVQDSWENVYQIISFYGNKTEEFIDSAGPGHWHDADMLVVGDYGLSLNQQKIQMGMWALFASPLFMSVDLRDIDNESKKILLNKEVIAISQDPLGIQGRRMFKYPVRQGNVEGWLRPLSPAGTYAVGILNSNNFGWLQYVNKTLSDFGLTNQKGYDLIEVFTGKKYGPLKPLDELILKMEPTSLFLAVAVPLS